MRRRSSGGTKKCCRGPSLLKQMQSFAAGIVSLAVDGEVPSYVAQQRLTACGECPQRSHLIVDWCDACGCALPLKTKVKDAQCPEGRWMDNGKWAVGMTTAPRRESTVRQALASHRLNGWEPILFAEPGSDLAGIDAPIVQNTERLGVWFNWVQQATKLLEWFPDATHILTTQDDCEFVPGTRELVDAYTFPEDAAFVSLYLPMKIASVRVNGRRERRPPGIQPIEQARLHGSLALAFPRNSLERILKHPIARGWSGQRYAKNGHPPADDDICIGKCVADLGLKMYYAVPSCSQHIAPYSAREGGGSNKGIRQADWVAANAVRDCRQEQEALR